MDRAFGAAHMFMGPVTTEGAAPMTSDLQAPILDGSCFIGPAGVSDQLADFGVPPPVTMETSSMGGIQNQQPCKYDLLNSVPRE